MTKTEIIKEFYAALNRNDIPAVLIFCDQSIERIESLGSPSPGIFRGLSEFETHLHKGRSSWAEGGCAPEKFVEVRDKIVVFVHVRVRLKDKQEWIDGHTFDVFAFRNGKVIEMSSFMDNQQALEWANSSRT